MKSPRIPFTKHQLQLLREVLRGKGIVLAYLYGSQARGDAKASSDTDFAVVLRRKIPPVQKLQKRLVLMHECSKILKSAPVDLVFYADLPLQVQFEALRDSVLLFSDDENRRIDLEHRTMSRYFDRQYYIRRHSAFVLEQTAAQGILR